MRLSKRRADPPGRERRWIFLVCCGVLGACLALIGCSVGLSGTDDSETLDSAAAIKEYEGRTGQLSLPEGVRWPALQTKAADGTAFSYSRWAPTVQAEEFWGCAWKREWLAGIAADDDSRAQAALSQLATFQTMRTYQKAYDQASRDAFDNQLRRAKLGDPSAIQRDVDLNCPDT